MRVFNMLGSIALGWGVSTIVYHGLPKVHPVFRLTLAFAIIFALAFWLP